MERASDICAMPLVAWCALAYAGGLLAGITLPERHGLLAAVVLAALAAGAVRLHRGWTGGVMAIAAGGVLVAAADVAHERACGQTLAARHQWELRVDVPVADGDIARGWVSAQGCERRAMVFVETGSGAPGELLALTGRAELGERSLVVQQGGLRVLGDDAVLPRLRARTSQRIDRIFTADAPLVRALVIADMSAIDAAQRDRYADAGLVHMLSVSGLHVGIIALALELLGAALRLPKAPTRVASLVLLVVYVAAIGAPPPAVRAAVMLGVLLASRLRQRPTSRWAILALGGVVPLVVPGTVLDLGWQLSVAGTAALVAGGVLVRRVVPRSWRGLRRTIATGIIISVVATVTTAPLVAWAIGRVALVGPLTNLLADPIMGLLQPVLFVALCIPIPPIETLCADAAHALIALFDAIARAGAAVPGGAQAITPSTTSAILTGVAAVAALVACASRQPARAMLIAASAIALLMLGPIVRPDRAFTELHVIDVGQGDAIALRTRRDRWILVDAGRSWLGGDAGRSTVVPYLAHRGGSLALFVLSHPHADHVGGAASVFASLHPSRFLDPGYVGTSPPYLAALTEAARARVPWQRVHPGDSLRIDEVLLTALAPESTWVAGLTDANLASTVLVARVGAIRFLFTGDAEAPEEEWLLAHDADALAADVLKVGHHGSRTSTTPRFLGAVRPRLALVSVGAHNAYGHPSPEVMQTLRDSGAQVLRTDRVGTIIVSTDGRHLEVEARNEKWSIPERVGP
ncbi:MAG: DNA internalization-related competence protein ComEC/Rec2 [Gemmatimonadetes bacterium]|nr:MAG: DNA internalization-related competence protein ComEC/Rec2 [Gemmatimonadota bacterium]